MNKLENVVIIPARGGSKGIKNKNLINFANKPLLYWTIKQAIKSKSISRVYVSSDSTKILEFSKKLGAFPIIRPKKIAKDMSKSEDAIIHFIESLGKNFKNIIFLQATSPLRLKRDIDNAVAKFKNEKYDSLFSCSTSADWFDVWKTNKKKIVPITIDYKNKPPRQKVKDKYFLQNGSLYIFKKDGFLKYKNRLFGKIGVYIMKEWQSFQIDENEQVNFMEVLFKKFILNEKIK
jgi:N-acylneuraminate cytidylyltransferase